MKLYKNGSECEADLYQVQGMIDAGWSKTKQVPKAPVKPTPKPVAKAPAKPAAK